MYASLFNNHISVLILNFTCYQSLFWEESRRPISLRFQGRSSGPLFISSGSVDPYAGDSESWVLHVVTHQCMWCVQHWWLHCRCRMCQLTFLTSFLASFWLGCDILPCFGSALAFPEGYFLTLFDDAFPDVYASIRSL